MKIKILRWSDNAVIYDGEAVDLRTAVEGLAATGASLTYADLTGANLRGADLTGASLTGASLTGADLRGANLRDADLTDANLTGASLTGASLRSTRDDLWAVLSSAPAEVPGLLTALKEGRVNGSTYEGACACLVGTLANVRGCAYTALAPLVPDSGRPAEVWFLQIKIGDTPETNQAAKLAAEWIDEWLARMRAAFGAAS